jgi:hypothetical protein
LRAAPVISLFLASLAVAGLAMPQQGLSQSLGGAQARARAYQSAPYSTRRAARSYTSTATPYRSQMGFFERLFGPTTTQRRQPGNGHYGWQYYRGSGYRTMCVRLCDGYYWPISFSATSSGLRGDAARCENSCGTPARMFYQRSPGGDAKYMVDLSGKRYADLENAFRYREEYVENCKCKPEPWSTEARAEYEARAERQLAAASNNGGAETAVGETGDGAVQSTPVKATRKSRPRRAARRRPSAPTRGLFSWW